MRDAPSAFTHHCSSLCTYKSSRVLLREPYASALDDDRGNTLPDRFTMPFPAFRDGTWSWQEDSAGGASVREFGVKNVPPWDDAADAPALLRDGRLVLKRVQKK